MNFDGFYLQLNKHYNCSVHRQNYKNLYNFNLNCKLCKSQICDQQHLLQCSVLKTSVPELAANIDVKYNDLFGDIEKIVPAIKLFSKIVRKREELLELLEEDM